MIARKFFVNLKFIILFFFFIIPGCTILKFVNTRCIQHSVDLARLALASCPAIAIFVISCVLFTLFRDRHVYRMQSKLLKRHLNTSFLPFKE